jgi:scaffold protein (connect acetoacetyl-CoA thiolase and HMG-CoA synthase)
MGLTTARYWREIPQRYRMEAGKCTACGEVHFPPRRVCMKCGKREFTTVVLPETGTVETYTVIRVAPDEFTDLSPYAVALVKLENGTKLMCQLVDIDLEKIEIGLPVKLEFRRIRDDGQAGMLFYGYKVVPA